MPIRPESSSLNASTIKILNTIRANAPLAYQSAVGTITSVTDIPKVGESIMGTPGLANMFISELMNRIAFVAIKSATFNNKFAALKKGYLSTGEIVEEVFIEMCKAVEFNPEKGAAREFARNLPDVRSAMHFTNYRVVYPVTVSRQQLRGAFTTENGVADLIAKIFRTVYTAAEYDEYLLFKYLIIKGIAGGKLKPVTFDSTDMEEGAVAFRSTSNVLEFPSTKYNAAGVHNSTPRAEQYIFMDAAFNAAYDVNVLAAAFNMDKATFMGNLILVDSFTEFDNDRFSAVRAGSDQISEVTSTELTAMADVKAVLVDKEWFQVYDREMVMLDTPINSALEWNYFLHIWKVVATSPFSNAVVFMDDGVTTTAPATLTATVLAKEVTAEATIITFGISGTMNEAYQDIKFIYSKNATAGAAQVSNHVAIHPYGVYVVPAANADEDFTIDVEMAGAGYSTNNNAGEGAVTDFTPEDVDVGDTFTLTKDS